VPRTDCPEDGVLRITVPWAREGSRFTLLFEQAALMLVREMPVLAAARIIGVTDQRLWRIVEHYVTKAVTRLDRCGRRLPGPGVLQPAIHANRGHQPRAVRPAFPQIGQPMIAAGVFQVLSRISPRRAAPSLILALR
jgi:hypothetical protein